MRKNIIKTLTALILSVLFNFMNAQEYDKINGVWNATFLDIPLSDKLNFRTELHFRTISYFGIWDQQLFRPQLSFSVSKNVSWRGGYTYIRNFDQDISADPRVKKEHNIWEQVQFTLPLKKSSFSTWIRLEHRFQEQFPQQNDGSSQSFDFSSRLRFRLTYQKRLSKADAKTLCNLVIYDEIFSILNPRGIPYKFNQNWTFLGFQLKINDRASLITGFQKNTIAKSQNNYLINRLWNNILFYKF